MILKDNTLVGIVKASVECGAINIEFDDTSTIKFEDCWLRDNCRCIECYNAETFQRANHLLDIPEALIMDMEYDDSKIKVIWSDKHESIFKAEFLSEFQYDSWMDRRRLKPILWRGTEVMEQVKVLHADDFLKSDEGARAVFQSLLNYGVAFIDNVDVSVEGTEKVCETLGGVQNTMFGGMWKFTTVQDHADTAYTNLPLAVHNDNTYFTEAAGLQILHCLEHSNGTGGETILVDGFYGATKLRKEFPEDFDFLTKFNLEAIYLEDGHHHRYNAPVIQLDKMTDIKQIRFNVYDRAAMAFSSSNECRTYYSSLRNLSRYYQDPTNQWLFKLKPGLVVVMDNFRVLHGRTGFTGKRVLCGSYVSRSDWLDKARTLRLIH